MPPRPLFDHAMTAAERQRRRRLKLSGGPAPRFEREVMRALSAGMTAMELVQRIEAIAGGSPVPADPTSAAGEAASRDASVTTPPPEPKPQPSPVATPRRDKPVTKTRGGRKRQASTKRDNAVTRSISLMLGALSDPNLGKHGLPPSEIDENDPEYNRQLDRMYLGINRCEREAERAGSDRWTDRNTVWSIGISHEELEHFKRGSTTRAVLDKVSHWTSLELDP